MNASGLNTRHDGEEPKAPARLVAALKAPPPRRVFVPPTVDETVLAAARRHFAKPRWFGFRFLGFRRLWQAMATAGLVLAGISYLWFKPAPSRFAREDVNHDGRVDILDAFALARQLRANLPPPALLDLNGDGVVDRRDAERIAARAVELEKGGRS